MTLLIVLVLIAPATQAAWPMENADASNLGALRQSTPGTLDEHAKTDVDTKVLTQVVQGPAGLALAGSLGGTLYAIDARGEIIWQADVPGPIRTAPAWTGELIVVVPRGSEAVAFSATGERIWSLPIENERPGADLVRMASPVVHPSGAAIVADMAGTVRKVNEVGRVVWSYEIGGDQAIEATPAVTGNGDVIVAAFTPGEEGRGTLARVSGITGDEIWRQQLGSQVVGAPTVVDGRVLVPLRDGDALTARSLSDGSLQWSTPFDDHLTASPSIHEGLAVVGDIRGTVRGVEVGSGEVAWSFSPLQQDTNPDHLASGGTALTIADSVAIDGAGRAWVAYWAVDLTGGFPPTDSADSPFYIIDAEDGDRIDRLRFPKAVHGPAIHETGVWVGSDEEVVRRFPLPDGFLGAHAVRRGEDVTLVVNTDRSGDWSIRWGSASTEDGSGVPPTISSRTLPAGEHTIEVTVGSLTRLLTLTVPGEPGGDPGGAGTEGSDGTSTPPTPGAGGSSERGDEGRVPDEAPVPWLAALITILVLARRRRRA